MRQIALATIAVALGGGPAIAQVVRGPGVVLSLEVPAELGNRKLAELGFVDVTAAPFRADATAKSDSTEALQRAINFAREHQMVTFFPRGTYAVRDTLVCVHGRHDPNTRRIRRGGRDWPCVLVGSRRGRGRPRIALADHSPGFGDPGKPKYVIHFWARSAKGRYDQPQPNINMNQMLVGIDVGIGEGNPGAVAIRHRAAQGSGVQDCTIDATHGLTGLEGGAGSGGSHAKVTVTGGRTGADMRQTQPAPTITGFTLINQTGAALRVAGRQTLAAVGLHVKTNKRGPVIVTEPGWGPHHGQLCLIDSVIDRGAASRGYAVHAGSSLTMHDVYVRNVPLIVRGPKRPALGHNHKGWVRVNEFALAVRPPPLPRRKSKERLHYRSSIFLDGKETEHTAMGSFDPVEGPPADLQSRHLWGDDFPTFESPGCANVKAPPYHAKGDGRADDHAAIQKAIDQNEIVLLPKGVYAVSRTLQLRPKTKLIGVHRCFTWLVPLAKEGGQFGQAAGPQPIVRTADDAGAETILAFLGIRTAFDTPGAYCLDWRAGRKSIFRAVNVVLPFWPPRAPGPPKPYNHPLVIVRGSGGGKWYNFHQESWRHHGPKYRHLLIDGTREPLHLYQCNPEHARGETNMELRKARFVSIYGVKGEYNRPIVTIRDCDHVRLFGYGGNAAASEGTSLFVVERTANFLLANLVDTPRLAGEGSDDHFAGRGVDPRKWHMVIERPADGPAIRTPPMERPVLYRRGRPRGQ